MSAWRGASSVSEGRGDEAGHAAGAAGWGTGGGVRGGDGKGVAVHLVLQYRVDEAEDRTVGRPLEVGEVLRRDGEVAHRRPPLALEDAHRVLSVAPLRKGHAAAISREVEALLRELWEAHVADGSVEQRPHRDPQLEVGRRQHVPPARAEAHIGQPYRALVDVAVPLGMLDAPNLR